MKVGLLYEIEVEAGKIRHHDIVDSLSRFGRDVIPQFKTERHAAAGA